MTLDLIWKSLPLKPREVSLARVLRCGQTFRWKNIDNVWSFTTQDRIILLKQDDTQLHYGWIMAEWHKNHDISRQQNETLQFISDYFVLGTNLEALYDEWQAVDLKYHKITAKSPFKMFPGIRILRQDPWETVVSFICSSNNNVKRISKMCDSLCTEFGTYINEYNGVSFYSFPLPEALARPGTEQALREFGFGYRAKYIYNTACKFVDPEYPDISIKALGLMRQRSFEEAHEFLLQLTGVGPKVADCICLMALDKHDVVPVDTHVYQIAVRDFKFRGKRDLKTMNKQVYDEIRQYFKGLFGEYAGWAQLVLFASDLGDLNNGINLTGETKVEAVSVKQETDGATKDEATETVKAVKKETATVKKETTTVKKETVGATIKSKRKGSVTVKSVKKVKTE